MTSYHFAVVRSDFTRSLVTFSKRAHLSLVEFVALLSFSLMFLIFDVFFAFTEDDVGETVILYLASFLFVISFLVAFLLNVQYYYMLNAAGGSDLTLRLIYFDLVSNGLCFFRLFLCWVRYIFYDMQSEVVDFVTHYTELNNDLSWGVFYGLTSAAYGVLWALFLFLLDLQLSLLQILLSVFKLAIALSLV